MPYERRAFWWLNLSPAAVEFFSFRNEPNSESWPARTDLRERANSSLKMMDYHWKLELMRLQGRRRRIDMHIIRKGKALVPEMLASLSLVYTKSEQKNFDYSPACAICLSDFEEKVCRITTLLCNPSHSFHTICIVGWVRLRHFCPLCKHPIIIEML